MACESNLSTAMEKFKTTAELWDVSQHMANALFFTVKTIKAVEKVCRDGEPATKRRKLWQGPQQGDQGRHFHSSERVRPTSSAPQD